METQKECMHSKSKRGIFICGSSYEGITQTEHVYICDYCGEIYLHRYSHWASRGEERTDIIMPGETIHEVTFHEATATLIKAVSAAAGAEQLKAIDRQAIAIRNYVLERLENLEHDTKEKRSQHHE